MRVISFNRFDWIDITYSSVDAQIWSIVEQSVGITCACLPCLRPLLLRMTRNRRSNIGLKDSIGSSSAARRNRAAGCARHQGHRFIPEQDLDILLTDGASTFDFPAPVAATPPITAQEHKALFRDGEIFKPHSIKLSFDQGATNNS